MRVDKRFKMLCLNDNCRVKVFMRGVWDLNEYMEEESGAWSVLKRTWCPGCAEEGELQ